MIAAKFIGCIQSSLVTVASHLLSDCSVINMFQFSKLRVDTRDMGLECDVCKVWAHTKLPKKNTKPLRKNTPRLAGSAKNAKR